MVNAMGLAQVLSKEKKNDLRKQALIFVGS
jgi:hypothetical protein